MGMPLKKAKKPEDSMGAFTKDNPEEYFIDKTYTEDGKRKMLVSRDELEFWQIPLSQRDYCSHILVKLTECRKVNYASPFSCHHELHEAERCQWEQFRRRIRQKELWEQAKKNVEEKSKQ